MFNNSNDYMSATDEDKEIIRETRCFTHFMVTGDVPCVCKYCGNVFVHERNAKRHVKTSKRCLELRKRQ